MDEPIWEDHHHRSSFLPNASSVDFYHISLISTGIVNNLQTPVLLQNINSEGNLCNITQTTPIDILVKLEIVDHVHVGQNCSTKETESYRALFKEFCASFSWTYEEMLGIDLSIIVHKIKNYPMTRPV